MNAHLEHLKHLIPPPPEARDKDWEQVQRDLGSDVPEDYKELIHTYAGSHWDDYLYILEPGCPNENYDLLTWNRHQMEDLEDLWEFEEKPERLREEGSRVMPWATTDNGECLYWLVRRGQPAEHWTIMTNEARGDRWEHFDTTCTGFLAAALNGEITSAVLSSQFPLRQHKFSQL